MKIRLSYFFLFCTIYTLSAQQKDFRAELEGAGNIKAISVSPSEAIWLSTSTGEVFYCNKIDEDWHYSKEFYKPKEDNSFSSPSLDKISFFNNDTAIMTGYISATNNGLIKNGYYRTIDGGKTWALLDFGGGSWIYNIFTNPKGHAWMGGSSEDMYISNDYGRSWKTIPSPFGKNRIMDIYMSDTASGIAASNHLYITNNNWKSSHTIPSPFDQKKYVNDPDDYRADNRLNQAVLWKNFIVVDQQRKIFYSDKENIDWKEFPLELTKFAIEYKSNFLYALTKDGLVVRFSNPEEYQIISNKKINFSDMEIKNNSVYYYNYTAGTVGRINVKGHEEHFLYTRDHPIPTPTDNKKATYLKWGTNNKNLYLSDDFGNTWYRKAVFNFSIEDFALVNDSAAILWDGTRSYWYSLKDNTAKVYFYSKPFDDFIKRPVQRLKIELGTRGCFHYCNSSVEYSLNGKWLTSDSIRIYGGCGDKKEKKFKNSVSTAKVDSFLSIININPFHPPALADFKISSEDVSRYKKDVDDFKAEIGEKSIDKAFYKSVCDHLDTMNTQILDKIINPEQGRWSTTSYWMKITFCTAEDSLELIRSYYGNSHPWFLPLYCNYNGRHFYIEDLDFSKFIKSLTPKTFMGYEYYDNKNILWKIAEYHSGLRK